MNNFFAVSNIFDLFKEKLLTLAEREFNALPTTKSINKLSLHSVRSVKKIWTTNILNKIDEGLKQFNQNLVKKIFELINEKNPYTNYVGGKITVFPEGTRFFYRNNNYAIVAIETKPEVRTLTFYRDKEHSLTNSPDKRRISLPFLVFIPILKFYPKYNQWREERLYLGARTSPLSSLEDMLCEAPFPDLNKLAVCLGEHEPIYGQTVNECCSQILERFWNAPFMPEWENNLIKADKRFKTFDSWAAATKLDPLIGIKAKYTECVSLINFISNVAINFPGIFGIHNIQQEVANVIGDIWEDTKDQCLMDVESLGEIYEQNLNESLQKIIKDISEKVVDKIDEEFQQSIFIVCNALAKKGVEQVGVNKKDSRKPSFHWSR